MTTTRETPLRQRRDKARRLAEQGDSLRTIADRLGVSKDTVRRDLAAVRRPETPGKTRETPVASRGSIPETDPTPNATPAESYGPRGLTLPPSLLLGQDLRLIAAAHQRPPEDVAAALIHEHAEQIRARWYARGTP